MGLTAGVRSGQLYMAGVIPGLLLAGSYCAYIIIRCAISPELAPPAPPEERRAPAPREAGDAAESSLSLPWLP
jgi:TRAP-type mannitol/chloroaromatic compound transport system permease large subunit